MSAHHEKFTAWRNKLGVNPYASIVVLVRHKTTAELKEQLNIIAPLYILERLDERLTGYFTYARSIIQSELDRREHSL